MVQLLLRGAGDCTQCIDVDPTYDVVALKECIEARTGIPVSIQGLVYGGKQLQDDVALDSYNVGAGSTVQLVYRLLGGKGGFGALLRGQGRNEKVTSNFDACRDLNGRRLRHTLAEEKLAAWRETARERELEQIAQRHIIEEAKKQRHLEAEQVDVEAIRAAQDEAITKTQQAVHDALNNSLVARGNGNGAVGSSSKGSSSPETHSPSKKRKAEEQTGKADTSAAAASKQQPPAKKSKMLAMLEDVGTDTSSEDDE